MDFRPFLVVDIIAFLNRLAEPEIVIIFVGDKTFKRSGCKLAAAAFTHITFVYKEHIFNTLLFGLDGGKTSGGPAPTIKISQFIVSI